MATRPVRRAVGAQLALMVSAAADNGWSWCGPQGYGSGTGGVHHYVRSGEARREFGTQGCGPSPIRWPGAHSDGL
jgi:hypothetical protein